MGITLDDWACWLRNERGQAIIVRRKLTSHLPHPHGVHAGRANATRRSAATSSAPRLAKSTDYEANRFARPRRERFTARPSTASNPANSAYDSRFEDSPGRPRVRRLLNSPVAANRTAEFGRDAAQSAADLRQVGTGTGSTEVCIPEVGRGLRVQVRHGGLLGCGGACHRSSLTSNGFHDEQVKPVRRM